jgi:potassium-transporting ATPase potassium-binding subunit
LGPLASWDSAELLGTNGGGYFATNLGNPLQNPSAFTNDFACLLMMLLGFSAPFMFAEMVRKPKEVQPLLATILVIFLVALGLFFVFEISNPFLAGLPVSQNLGYTVGAESRFTLGESSLFQVTSIYNNVGAVTMQLQSLAPGAQMVLLWGMFLQCAPGGVGTGFGTLLINVILAIFVGGLMVGRSPEYIGNKIEGGSVKWSVITFLSHPFAILVPLAIFSSLGWITEFAGHGPQAFTQVLYEFTSESANNGSGMGYPGGLGDANVYFNVTGALIMLFSRYFPILAMLAIGGALSRAPVLPPGPGTLKTQSATFTFYLIVFILVVTGLIFLPVLALGPFSSGVTFP